VLRSFFCITQKPEAEAAALAKPSSMVVLVPKMDFLLGIADLTGELVRNSAAFRLTTRTST
jgi:predicted translin family RNA/ssDNA-binding protein